MITIYAKLFMASFFYCSPVTPAMADPGAFFYMGVSMDYKTQIVEAFESHPQRRIYMSKAHRHCWGYTLRNRVGELRSGWRGEVYNIRYVKGNSHGSSYYQLEGIIDIGQKEEHIENIPLNFDSNGQGLFA